MNLADKPCYPFSYDSENNSSIVPHTGITFRERLIIALAGNPAMILKVKEDEEGYSDSADYGQKETNVLFILEQADAIIKEIENEKPKTTSA